MGSLASNIMLASASMVARLLASSATEIEKVTNPWPDVPLLGGRNPMAGSDGVSPVHGSTNALNLEPLLLLEYYLCHCVIRN